MILVIVAVPAAVVLLQIEDENGALRIGDRRFRVEDSFARLVAQAGSGVDAPRRFVFAVDGEFNRPGDAALIGLIIKHRIQHRLGKVDVGSGFRELDLRDLFGCVRRCGLHFKFRECAGALQRAPRTTQRQVRIIQQFELECRDVLNVRLNRHLHAMLRRRVALRQHRAIFRRNVLLAAV